MIKKQILSIIFLFTIAISFAQEHIAEFKNSLKTTVSDIKDVISIVNEKTGELAYFIADAKNVYAYKLNNKFEVIDKLSSEEKRRKYKILIGYSITNEGSYIAYLTNKSKNKFLAVKFSFKDKKTSSKEFKFKIAGTKFIQTVSRNNKFYMISAKKAPEGLFFHEFDDNLEYKVHQININDLRFITNNSKKANIGHLLTYNKKDLSKIDENLPNPIEVVADDKKMYANNNKVIFSFDNHKNFTQLLIVDLKKFNAESKIFNKSLDAVDRYKKKTNSFINGNDVFLVASTKEKLVLDIVDFNTKEKKKSFTILKDKPIEFKNTPIIQKGGLYNNYRELEKTKKFLRKINANKLGISARKNNNGIYHLVLGGYSLQQSPGMMMGGMLGGMMGGIAIASFGNATVFFNPAQFAYNTSLSSKSTRIECLFNNKFEHVKGEIKDNAFDKMKENKPKSDIGLTVTKYRDFFIRGVYNRNNKTYILEKFTNND